jgi:hypothetical protein
MGPKMVRRHEIQIVNTLRKKRPCFGEKFRRRDRAAVVLDRDLIVLTEKTLAGAAAKKDRAGTLGSRKRRLFSEMRADERNATGRALPAET